MSFLIYTGLLQALFSQMLNNLCLTLIIQFLSGVKLQAILKTCQMSSLIFLMNLIQIALLEMMLGGASKMVVHAQVLITTLLATKLW